MIWPAHRTGMHRIRTRSRTASSVISPSMISPSFIDRVTSGRSDSVVR